MSKLAHMLRVECPQTSGHSLGAGIHPAERFLAQCTRQTCKRTPTARTRHPKAKAPFVEFLQLVVHPMELFHGSFLNLKALLSATLHSKGPRALPSASTARFES